MEGILRELQEVMQAHRRALSESRAAQEVAPACTASATRDALVDRLARDIERISGIEISGMMEAKLGRVLASVALTQLTDWVARLHFLPADDPEWLSLVESLTVHETFFHRDRAQLQLLRGQVLPEVIAAVARSGRRSLHLWSAGCATGEEAYTLAILALLALRDAGFAGETADGAIECVAPWQLEVLGSDISRVVLVQAEAATYPSRELGSFRHLPRELERFFSMLPREESPGGQRTRRVHPAIRRHVRFAPFNLVGAVPPASGFDIVLCRNVLMYLTNAARHQALAVLQQALRPGGYLMLGPTDALIDRARYEPCWGEGSVAYRLKPRDG
jgi:chemotaxis protein methyltransferase CheR